MGNASALAPVARCLPPSALAPLATSVLVLTTDHHLVTPTHPLPPPLYAHYTIYSIHHNTSSPFVLSRRSINPGHPPHFRYPITNTRNNPSGSTLQHTTTTESLLHPHSFRHRPLSSLLTPPALAQSLSPRHPSIHPTSCSGGRISTTRTTTTGQTVGNGTHAGASERARETEQVELDWINHHCWINLRRVFNPGFGPGGE
jgi:hypothetical protein